MRLAQRFALVSAVTLLIPWAGCQYLQDVEQALRQGQAASLGAVAAVVARTVRGHESLQTVDPLRFASERTRATDVYAFPLATAPDLDGYADDWLLPPGALETISAPSGLRVSYQAGRTTAAVFLFLEVFDTRVVYGGHPETDRVRVRVGNRDGAEVDLVFATPAPGLVRPLGAAGGTRSRVQAMWEPTSRGFNLEIRLPAGLADRRLGFIVTDYDGDEEPAMAGTLPDVFSEPGWLIQPLTGIAAELGRLARPGQRLRIIDPAGFILAEAGRVERNDTGAGAGLLYRSMRFVLGGPPPGTAVRGTRPGRADAQPIAAVFRNEAVDLRLAGNEARRVVLTSARPLPIGGNVNVALVAEEDSELLLSLTDTAASRLFISTLSVSLAAMLALLGFAAWLAWRIRRLSRASRALAAHDERFGPDLPDSDASDELGDLSRDLTRLLTRVGEYNTYLKGLGARLTHELRTPLTIVATSLENLQTDADPDRSRVYLGRARQGIGRMQAMVAALGAASRVEEAVGTAEMETFDLAVLVSELAAAYGASHPQRRIDARVAPPPCPFRGAPELIAQMLDKLLENALDFCPDDGTISIELEAQADDYVLGVSNTGSRLPAGRAARLFDSMFSARGTDAGRAHLGLGLYIVQLIARHHDGTVTARNLPDQEGVGVFATFRRPPR